MVEAPAGRYDETTVEVEYAVFDTVETGPVTVAVLEAVTVFLLVVIMSTRTPHETVLGYFGELSRFLRLGRFPANRLGRALDSCLFLRESALAAGTNPGEVGIVVVEVTVMLASTVIAVVAVIVFVTGTTDDTVCVVVKMLITLFGRVVVFVVYMTELTVTVFGCGWTVVVGVIVATHDAV